MSYDRKLIKGETTTLKSEVVKVDECIKYIESCGYEIQSRNKGRYSFYNPNRPDEHKWMVFSLAELRETYHNGW